ncbi:nuclear transport factor 2 family protein [Streptomyces sp. NPDC054796]
MTSPMSGPMSGPAETVTAFVQHMITADVDRALAHYEPGPDTYSLIEGPSTSLHGDRRLREGWEGWFASGLRLLDVTWAEGPFEQRSGDIAWITGAVDARVRTPGTELPVRFGVTWILRRTDDRWAIAHDHYSIPAADPYGVGEWAHPGQS